jgi:hypothetical protein
MSNRKAHRRAHSFRRGESFVQHRLRRPERSDRQARRLDERRERRGAWTLIRQWLSEGAREFFACDEMQGRW